LIRWLKNKADFLAKSEAWEHSQQIEQKSKAPKLSNESLNSGHQNLDEIERLSQIAKMSSSLAQHGNQQRCTRNETKKKILATALGTRRGNQNQKQWKEIELGTWTAEKRAAERTASWAGDQAASRDQAETAPGRSYAQLFLAVAQHRATLPKKFSGTAQWLDENWEPRPKTSSARAKAEQKKNTSLREAKSEAGKPDLALESGNRSNPSHAELQTTRESKNKKRRQKSKTKRS
jgi:hypothetical protein